MYSSTQEENLCFGSRLESKNCKLGLAAISDMFYDFNSTIYVITSKGKHVFQVSTVFRKRIHIFQTVSVKMYMKEHNILSLRAYTHFSMEICL